MGIIAAGQITVVDLSDAPVLNTSITASRSTTQTYSKDSGTYKPSYASTPQVLTLKLTKAGSTANIIDSISSLHWFVVDGPIKTEITSKDNSANEYISGTRNEILTTKLDIDLNKGSKRYEVMGIWPDPSTGLDVQFGGYIDLLLTQNGATGPQGPQGDTGNGIANTVITYGLSMSDTTEPATWSSEMPTLVKGMYLWTRTVIIYTNGNSTTSYQISYIAKDADATAEIDKAKQELLEKLETVRDESLEAVDEAKQQLVTVRDESLAAAEEAKQGLINVTSELNTAKQDLADSVNAVNIKVDSAKEELTQAKQQLTTVADDLSTAKQDFQNAVSAVDTKATNLKNDLTQAKQDLASQAQQLQEQASAQSELTNRVSSVEKTANGTKTTVSELSKTVAQNGKDITSVTNRTKTVEDDLANTKTTLTQVQTTANSASQKTATLETGLNGLSAKFDNLKIGGRNLLTKTNQGKTNWSWKISSGGATAEDFDVDGINAVKMTRTTNASASWDYIQYNGLMRKLIEPDTKYTLSFDAKPNVDVTFSAILQRGDGGGKLTNSATMNKALANQWTKVSCVLTSKATLPDESGQVVYLAGMPITNGNWLIIKNIKLEKGNIATDYSPNEADLEQKVAEYKQNADQNYASLQTTVQNLDGTVQQNKTTAEQTAAGFKTRIESLETYKDGESERANAYFESAKTETAKQLTAERTAIAKDYVAKSTYTSDVTGIRNELSATTSTANATKTNLANYQANNDKMVASLKSSLQTTDGNVSNLQTKVEAVPGQITSAVSAVEGKIPTNVSTRNLILKSNDFAKPHKQSGANTTVTSTDDYFIIKSTGYTANAWGGMSWNMSISEVKAGEQFSILMPVYIDNSIALDGAFGFNIKNHPLNLAAYGYDIPTNKKDQWFNVAITFKASKNVVFDTYPFYVFIVKNGLVRIKPPMLVRGNLIPSDYQPAFEDTESDITKLSSEIKQTADGITLLATKTELNTVRNELQSGINTATNKADAAQNTANNNAQTISTHTTQISALNTGLQAKVSQTDFNTLSGRVTTAENNITAKANELSSKITSVEGKIPTSVGGRNLLSKTNQGKTNWYWSTSNSGTTSEDHNVDGVNAVKLTRTIDGSVSWSYVQYQGLIRKLIEPNTKYTLSFDVYPSQDVTFSAILQHGDGGSPLTNVGSMNKALANKWSKVSCVLTSKETLSSLTGQVVYLQGMPIAKGNYLIIKNIKLEKGVVSTDWSPAPEDTAEQISSLSSQIKQTADGITLLATKTELNNAKNELQSGINTATNKANSAQSTANNNAQTISTHTTQISALNTGLQAKVSQSDFNTLSGRVTTAENNITAKANELTSKITSVEGKIPTSIGARNYIRNYGLTATGWTSHNSGWKFEIISDNTAKSGQYLKATCTTASTSSFNGFYKNLFDFSDGRFFGKQMTWSMDVKTSKNTKLNIGCEWGNAQTNVNTTENWQRFSKTFKVATSSNQKAWIFYGPNWNVGDIVYIRDVQLEEGSIATSPVPAIEDTESDITKLSSELTQTKDGITLLATKTELNTAKNDLQSGINTATNKANSAQSKANSNAQTISTHTTQISALNTGLQAKVSQSDFNTLSGRVTTAENNITAKANELSSKITSVEGKIPTSVGGRNLLAKTNQGKTKWSWNISSGGTTAENYDVDGVKAVKLTRTTNASASWDYIQYNGLMRKLIEPNTKYTLSFDVKPSVDVTFSAILQRGDGGGKLTNAANMNKALVNQWTKVSCVLTTKTTLPDDLSQVVYLAGMPTANGNWLIIKNIKLEKGAVSSDWSPAPEDTISQIDAVSSELKQTKDGITLLATKTELNNAKNDLQSGINTATNKANAAQNTADSAQNKANSNAQTINTHTTQISALNTGLQAKVSQSEFNTLSGRVTSAENNITAKANELSSKITNVEGKIPTSVGGRNLLAKTNQGKTKWSWAISSGGGTAEDYNVDGVKAVKLTRTSDSSYTWHYIRYDGLIRNLIEPNTKYTLSFDVKPNVDVTFSAILQRGDGGSPLTNAANMNKALANQWTKVSCVLTSKATLSSDLSQIVYLSGMPVAKGNYLIIKNIKLEKGAVSSDWSPAPEDTIEQISSLSSEFKQTTDSIKASVSSLDKSTVKSSSLTINSDGIVMKAGKTTTDVANAIGSYFSVNQNAINLFSDKINVKGSMIVNGTITGDKIKASSVDVSKISGLDANFIKSKIEYAMIDWLKGKTITAYNDNMVIDLQNGRISFKDGSNAVYRQTPDGIHTGFVHFEAGPQGGIQAAFGATSMRQGINSKTSAFAGIRCYRVSAHGDSHEAKIDKIELIGDVVQFGHGYASEGNIGGGFIMDNAIYRDDKPYSLNRMVRSIESLWRILHDHARNVGYNLSDHHFISALNDEYNAWYDMHNK